MNPAPQEHLWWLASRASGIVALALMTLAVLVGLALGGRISKRPGLAAALNTVHQQLSLAALFGIGLHGVTLLGDGFLRPGLAGITVPFAIDYKPAFVAAGIVGGYGAAALGLSYYMRRRIGSARWRKAHRFVIGAWALSVVHTLGAGTDATTPAMRVSMLVAVVMVLTLLAVRVLAGGRAVSDRSPRPPRGDRDAKGASLPPPSSRALPETAR